ncbi:sigma-70 family RNA polymerase sigma factor [Bacteroides thetaiotaomicron]|uniref:RNA polymerase ECF-type sigma factor n=1 Tax=Bacteroides thetaiotaomicron TaxID=818 RepID=A0A174P3W7_BACT4|nr:sigma-70 family RNA polymerase sigma factor [Bacteroides thetaiotaomicron]CUP54486.1 RNA polymerase ECF-type sigma factor [Bacteroides thetaiotaomicron]
MSKQQATFDDFFSECYLEKKEYIKNYIALRICHPHEAEDLAQDVFVRLWEYRAFVNKDTVWSLLFTIARNIVTDKIRRYYKQEDFVSYIHNNVKDEGRNTTDETLHYHELKKMHDGIIRSLPDKRRRIYELSFEHELSCPAIADRLSLSPRTVEGQLLLARKTIRTYLKKEFSRVG